MKEKNFLIHLLWRFFQIAENETDQFSFSSLDYYLFLVHLNDYSESWLSPGIIYRLLRSYIHYDIEKIP